MPKVTLTVHESGPFQTTTDQPQERLSLFLATVTGPAPPSTVANLFQGSGFHPASGHRSSPLSQNPLRYHLRMANPQGTASCCCCVEVLIYLDHCDVEARCLWLRVGCNENGMQCSIHKKPAQIASIAVYTIAVSIRQNFLARCCVWLFQNASKGNYVKTHLLTLTLPRKSFVS